jgi:hypothetical protein
MSFVQFQTDDSVVGAETIVSPMWSANVTNLTTFVTSSAQATSNTGKFYLEVYNGTVGITGSEVQFSIAYGNNSGSSASPFNALVTDKTATRDIYGQFRNLIFGDENTLFNFGGSNGTSQDIFILNINRARFKESIKPGSLSLTLSSGSNTMQLTDDSKDSSATNFIGTNRFYYIVSGSGGRSYNTSSIQTSSGSYGLLIPDMGLIILNPNALSLSYANKGIGLPVDTTTPSSYALSYNINNSSLFRIINNGGSFSLQSSETMTSRYFWVRVKNQQFNYTTNPSIIDSNGNILYTTLVDNPQTFVTTIGLYNDFNELLAVAKLSKPLPKDFTKEATVKVKLDF